MSAPFRLQRVLDNIMFVGFDRRYWQVTQHSAGCFFRLLDVSFDTAERTIQGVEAMNKMRKGQVKRLEGSDTMGQAKLVKSLFGIAA